MHLTPQDRDKLLLHQAGVLAQKRLARGLQLNYPEAVALIACQLLEFIRDGASVAELMDRGRRLLGRRQVLPGIPEMIGEVQVEGTFADGSKLVTVHQPIVAADGDLALALHGSFLPVPDPERFALDGSAGDAITGDAIPGEVLPADQPITINADRETCELEVISIADRPIQVGSHYPFAEVNPYLRFDRRKAVGMRLDIPAGTAVRFEPGDHRTVFLVAIAGNRRVAGGNRFAEGLIDELAPAALAARFTELGLDASPSSGPPRRESGP